MLVVVVGRNRIDKEWVIKIISSKTNLQNHHKNKLCVARWWGMSTSTQTGECINKIYNSKRLLIKTHAEKAQTQMMATVANENPSQI